MQPQPQPNRMSFWQKIELLNELVYISALTVMVFLRRDLGYRLLSPLRLTFITGALALFSTLAAPSYPDAGMDGLLGFAGLAFLLGAAQRAKRWRDYKRGVLQHSYYIGTSPFGFRWLPLFCRRDRRIERMVDPLFCVLVGVALLPLSIALGCWVIMAGVAVRPFEEAVRLKELHVNLDMLDGIVYSQARSQHVERYIESPNARQQRPPAGIPTGLGADIHDTIKQRKSDRPRR